MGYKFDSAVKCTFVCQSKKFKFSKVCLEMSNECELLLEFFNFDSKMVFKFRSSRFDGFF